MAKQPGRPSAGAPFIIFAGQEGSGKTTALVRLVEEFGGAIIPTEDGLQAAEDRDVVAFDVCALSTPDKPEAFLDDLYESFGWCWDNLQKGQVLGVDTISVLYQRLEQTVLNRYGESNIAACAGGYGKGFLEIRKEMMEIIDTLQAMRRELDVGIICTSHMSAGVIKNSPDVEAALVYTLAFDEKSAQLWRQQCQALLCIGFDTVVSGVETDNKGVVKKAGRVIKNSKRHLICDASIPAYSQLAKNRFNLPAKIVFPEDDLTWIDSINWFK